MTKQLLSTLAIALAVTFAGDTADAQIYTHGGGFGVSTVGVYGPIGGFYGRPSVPVYGTPSVVTGRNPWTGGWNTGNHEINNTYFDYGRNGSQYNGSKRWVNRPVYDNYGNITGYQRGYVWNNSMTGQEHGNVTTTTPNGVGGEHQTATMYSTMRQPQGNSK